MARISTYIKDENLIGSDLILATEDMSLETINIPLRALTDFVNRGLFVGFGDGALIASYQGNIVESFIKSEAEVVILTENVYLTTENDLFIPTGSAAYLILEVGSRVILTNGTGDSRDVGIVMNIDESSSSVIFSNNITNPSVYSIGNEGVHAVVLTSTTSTVTGDLNVTGDLRVGSFDGGIVVDTDVVFGAEEGEVSTWAEGDSTELIPNARVEDGGRGEAGSSAYEIALAADDTIGTEAEWLASLQGDNGLSAYEIAFAEDDTIGTESQWITSLQGDDGDSAYTQAVDDGFLGTLAEWIASLEGADGDSAYEVAVTNGFSGTQDQWIASLDGNDGSSAYALAVVDGFVGTVGQWIASLDGDDGDEGRFRVNLYFNDSDTIPATPPNAATFDGTNFSNIPTGWSEDFAESTGTNETYESFAEYIPATGVLSAWSAVFVVGAEGPPGPMGNAGRGIQSIILTSTTGLVNTYTITYIDGLPATSTFTVTNGADSTQQGPAGDSAYDVAVAAGFFGSETAWVASLVGDEGQSAFAASGFSGTITEWVASLDGEDGLSAYDIALAQDSTIGTIEQWVTSLIGETGQSAFAASGFSGTIVEWVASLDGEDGLSAYDIALANGFSGTMPEWIASLDGEPGISAYDVALSEGFIGSESAWVASLIGATGQSAFAASGFSGTITQWVASLDGEDGLSAYDIALANGFSGSITQWEASLDGENGDQAVYPIVYIKSETNPGEPVVVTYTFASSDDGGGSYPNPSGWRQTSAAALGTGLLWSSTGLSARVGYGTAPIAWGEAIESISMAEVMTIAEEVVEDMITDGSIATPDQIAAGGVATSYTLRAANAFAVLFDYTPVGGTLTQVSVSAMQSTDVISTTFPTIQSAGGDGVLITNNGISGNITGNAGSVGGIRFIAVGVGMTPATIPAGTYYIEPEV